MPDINTNTLRNLKDGLQLLEKVDLCELDDEAAQSVVQFVNSMRGFLAVFVQEEPLLDLFRITNNKQVLGVTQNQRLHRISQLKYPPAQKSSIGRANLPRTSVLYASLGRLAPMLELKPERGDLITLTQWSQINHSDRIRVGAIFQDDSITRSMPYFQRYMDRYNAMLAEREPRSAELMRATTSFVARQFTKQVAPTQKRDYLISAFVADMLLNHNGLEAIVYPSVPLGLLDVNIAIRPDVFDRLFRPVKASEQIVRTENYRSKTAETSNFEVASDTIVWNAAGSVPEQELHNLHTLI